MVSYIKVKIDNVLKGFNNKIPFMQPLYEAITNSLEAHAQNIWITFSKEELLDNETMKPKIVGFVVKDDGDGFNQKNRESFGEYLSSYKAELGCKGIGRFTWLKVFNEIKIKSQLLDECVTIDFDKSYSDDKMKITKQKADKIYTEISFKYVTDNYYNYKDKDERFKADIVAIKENIENHLMIKLFLLREEKKVDFSIHLILDDKEELINSENLPQLHKKSFEVLDEKKDKYDFNLYYKFSNDGRNIHKLHYCADGRTVLDFPKSIQFSRLADNASVTMLLASSYFDKRINNERNEFTFDPKENNPTLDNPLPMPRINTVLKENVDNIILQRYPDIKKENQTLIEECINENPHLGKYIRKGEYGLIYDKKDLLKKANAEFVAEKEKVLNNFKKMIEENNLSSDNFLKNIAKLNDISNRELAQYFHYRQEIINGLKDLDDNNCTQEELFHNLFMKKGDISDSEKSDYSPYNSNIWLLDDKYMSYTKMFSDKKIGIIKQQIINENPNSYGDGKEPDLAVFYNDSNGNIKDVVVVELKAAGATTPFKMFSLSEINRNLGFIAESIDSIETLYGYIITKIDSQMEKELNYQQGVSRLFTAGNNPIYYYYNDKIVDKNGVQLPCHVYILSTNTICEDAGARNKIFLDIIKNAN